MNPIADLGQWWNLIYVIPFGVGVLLTFLSVVAMGHAGGAHGHLHNGGHGGHGHAGHLGHAGGHGHAAGSAGHAAGGHGHAGAQAAGGHAQGASQASAQAAGGQTQAACQAGHAGAGHDAAQTASGQGHSQTHSAAQHTHSGDQGRATRLQRSLHGELATGMVAITGIGKVPLPLMLQMLLVTWGLVGWIVNRQMAAGGRQPEAFISTSIIIALCSSLVATRLLTEVFGRITPQEDETYAVDAVDLVGRSGEVTFRVTQTTGRVHTYDETGGLHELPARCRQEGALLEKGTKVIVVDYDPSHRWYWVEGWEPEQA